MTEIIRKSPLHRVIFYEYKFFFSRELFDRIFSLAGFTLSRIYLTIDEPDRDSPTSVLCSLATIMRLDTSIQIIGIARIERIVGAEEDVGGVMANDK